MATVKKTAVMIQCGGQYLNNVANYQVLSDFSGGVTGLYKIIYNGKAYIALGSSLWNGSNFYASGKWTEQPFVINEDDSLITSVKLLNSTPEIASNAISATRLKTPVNILGQEFNGTQDIPLDVLTNKFAEKAQITTQFNGFSNALSTTNTKVSSLETRIKNAETDVIEIRNNQNLFSYTIPIVLTINDEEIHLNGTDYPIKDALTRGNDVDVEYVDKILMQFFRELVAIEQRENLDLLSSLLANMTLVVTDGGGWNFRNIYRLSDYEVGDNCFLKFTNRYGEITVTVTKNGIINFESL